MSQLPHDRDTRVTGPDVSVTAPSETVVRVRPEDDRRRRRRGGAWLIPALLIGGLGLLLLLGILNAIGNGNRQTGASATPGASAGAGASATAGGSGGTGAGAGGNAITSVREINAADDRKTLAGRKAAISEARVLSVVGDRGFYVGPNKEEQVLVVLDEDYQQSENAVKVKEGQTLRITGDVREAGDAAGKDVKVTGDDLKAVADADIYVHADKVEEAGE
jgi:hypothetical protein